MRSLGAFLKGEKAATTTNGSTRKPSSLLSPLLRPFDWSTGGTSTRTDKEDRQLAKSGQDDFVRILVEIVGATDLVPHPSLITMVAVTKSLLQGGSRPATPSVVARWISPDGDRSATMSTSTGKAKTIHSTKPINNCNDPIWTARTGSLFLLDVPLNELPPPSPPGKKDDRRSGGARGEGTEKGPPNAAESALTLEVQDHAIGTYRPIGAVRLSCSDLGDILRSKPGERLEYDLRDDSEETPQEGRLALRFRLASARDIRFVECLREGNIMTLEEEEEEEEKEGLSADESTRKHSKQRLKRKLGIKNHRAHGIGIATDKEEVILGMMKTAFDPIKPIDFIRETAESTLNSTSAALKLSDKKDTKFRVKPGEWKVKQTNTCTFRAYVEKRHTCIF